MKAFKETAKKFIVKYGTVWGRVTFCYKFEFASKEQFGDVSLSVTNLNLLQIVTLPTHSLATKN